MKQWISWMLGLCLTNLSQANANPLVGQFAGTFQVEQGQATYTIPLNVTLGRGGLQPNLALIYNSAHGNGLFGLGWRIQGLSRIHRCHRTIAPSPKIVPPGASSTTPMIAFVSMANAWCPRLAPEPAGRSP